MKLITEGRPQRLRHTRQALAALATGSLLIAVATPAAATGPLDNPQSVPGSFASPGAVDRPLYRFWNTGGLMTAESAAEQVAQIKASGAGGLEANQLTRLLERAPGYNAATMSWGTPAWTRALTDLLRAGEDADLRVDSIYTPGWSAGTQTARPDQAGAAKEITFGSSWVTAGQTFDGPLPTSALPAGVTKRELQGVVAYRCVSVCGGVAGTPVLDPASAVELTAQVVDGRVSWTAPAAPADASYVVVAAWMAGTGQTIFLASSPTTTYLVDHFSQAGWDLVQDYWDTKVLTPDLRTALRAGGGSMFFDSLELNRDGHQVNSWTDDFLREFQARRGYSLVPYLAAVSVRTPAFDLSGGVGQRVREDYNETLSDLFRDEHLLPFKRWAASLGMTTRGQAYSSYGPTSIDPVEMATILDIPEGEDLSFNQGFGGPFITTSGSDVWRSLASATVQSGKKLLSSECCAFMPNAGIPRQKLLAHVNQQLSVGVNHIVWHGWADQSPGAATQWPGFSPFGSLISDVYGPQNPTFADDVRINDYVGRLQTVLRRGDLRNDVAIYRDDYGHSTDGSNGRLYFTDQSLARAGYTYGFMNDTLIADPTATVHDGRLAAGALSYGAFVLDNTANPETNPTLDLDSARRVLSWAQAGLPIVVVGELPQRVRGHHPEQDAALQEVNRQLLAARSVTRVGTQADVLTALQRAGVRSAASYAEPSPLVTLHRADAVSDYYYLFNSGSSRTTTKVTLQGKGTPYTYDAWTGEITPVGSWTRSADGVTVDVSLASGDSVLLAVTAGNADTPDRVCPAAVSTTAGNVTVGDGRLLLRSTTDVTATTQLSDGRTVRSRIADVPAPIVPQSWQLDVTSWQAGDTPNQTREVALPSKTVTAGPDGTLPNWQQIPGLEKVSGTARYTTTVDVGRAWTGGTGASLDLGEIRGLVRVTVNGNELTPVNQLDPTGIDVGEHLHAGRNTVVVHLSTLVGNAAYGGQRDRLGNLRAFDSYGLVGPVVLRPYGEALVHPCSTRRLGRVAELLTEYNQDGTISDRTTANLRDRLDRAVTFAADGRERPAIAALEQFVARVENQVKGNAADLTARQALVAAARAALEELRAFHAAE